MSNSGSQPTQTTTYTPPKQATDLINMAMPGIQQFSASVPQRYQGDTIAPFNEQQQQAQSMALGQAGGAQTDLANAGVNTNLSLLTDLWNPASNENLRNAITGATRPITQSLLEDALPAIRADFGGGNYGSSRRGIAEGQAVGRTEQAIGDTASKLVQGTYDTNVNATLKALGLLPQTMDATLTPARTTGAVGDVRQAMTQAGLNQDVTNFNYDQLAPFLQSKELLGLANQIPGGTMTAVGNTAQNSGVNQALSGAAAGATLGSFLGPVGTGVGAIAGGTLPFLLGR